MDFNNMDKTEKVIGVLIIIAAVYFFIQILRWVG